MNSLEGYKDKKKRLAYIKAYQVKNREKFRAYYAVWYRKNGKQYLKKLKEKPFYAQHRKKINRQEYQWKKINEPEKLKARYTLRKAVRSGKIVKLPCRKCGAIKVHGHHTNYSRPLNVIWLCITHHAEIHRGVS